MILAFRSGAIQRAHRMAPCGMFRAVLCLLIAPIVANATPLITGAVETGGDPGHLAAQYSGQTFVNDRSNLGTFTLGLFAEDALAFNDRNYQWNGFTNNSGAVVGLPAYLVGGEYVAIGVDRRDNPDYHLTLTVSQPVVVYLLIDNRGSATDGNATNPPDLGTGTNASGGPFMQWVLDAGFTRVSTGANRTSNPLLPDEVGVDEATLDVGPGNSVDSFTSVYARTYTSSTVDLGEYDAPFNTGRLMYGVVVVAVPEPSTILLLSICVLGFLSRRVRQQPRGF